MVKMFIGCVLLFSNLLTFNVLEVGAISLEEAIEIGSKKGYMGEHACVYGYYHCRGVRCQHIGKDPAETAVKAELYAERGLHEDVLAHTFLSQPEMLDFDKAAKIAIEAASKVILPVETVVNRMVFVHGVDPDFARFLAEENVGKMKKHETEILTNLRDGTPDKDRHYSFWAVKCAKNDDESDRLLEAHQSRTFQSDYHFQ
jgi:hypothetical protein